MSNLYHKSTIFHSIFTIRKYVNEYNLKKQELLNRKVLTNTNAIIDDIVAEPTYDLYLVFQTIQQICNSHMQL